MVKINLFVDREINLLTVFYQSSKEQSKFEDLNLKFGNLDKNERKNIKEILKNRENIALEIDKYSKIREIYNLNMTAWLEYWIKNEGKITEIKNYLENKLKNFDMACFKKACDFFDFELIKEIDICICMGNNGQFGTGNTFNSSICTLFPRKFENYTEKTLESDFAVMIHEIVHTFQKEIYSKEEREFIEAVTRAFAPRGILINREKCDKGSLEELMIPIIDKAILEGKTYFDVREELIEVYNKHK